MSIQTRVIEGDGTASVPPSRLAAVEGTITNRGHTFAETDYVETTAPFIEGHLIAGSGGATVFFDAS
jgi:hypothetical protein